VGALRGLATYSCSVDPDESIDPLARAESYLDDVRTGKRGVPGLGRRLVEDDPRTELDELVERLERLERVSDALAPRGGRQAAQLRSQLVGERAQIYVRIGALVARWVDRGGEVTLTLDPAKTRVMKPLPPLASTSLDDSLDEDADRTHVASDQTVVARAVQLPPRPPAPSGPAPTIASVLAETRRAVRPVRAPVPDGPPPDILGSDPGVPADDVGPEALADEMEWIEDQCNLLNRWKRSTAPLQHAVLSWLTARARWAQELLGPGEDADRVARAYPKLSAFSKRERPGFVYGLRRDHAPQGETWRDDAGSWRTQVKTLLEKEPDHAPPDEGSESNPERALARLEEILDADPEPETVIRAVSAALDAHVRSDDPRLLRLVEDHDEALASDPRFKRLRRALRSFAEGDADATMISEPLDHSLFGDSTLAPEEAARLDGIAKHLKILLVGGEPREQHRQRLESATGVERLEWAPATRGGGTGKLQSTAESIRQGSWDAVILLPRFCGHDVDAVLVPACKSSETPWLHVRGGYGVGPIREAVREMASRMEASAGMSDDAQAGA